MRGALGIPAGDPVHFGIAAGAIPLAFGVAGAAGLRYPVRLSPVLGLQLLYKTFFLIGAVLPMVLAGRVPGSAIPIIVILVLFAAGKRSCRSLSASLLPRWRAEESVCPRMTDSCDRHGLSEQRDVLDP